jgi:type VI secretion system protein ImpK
LTVSQSDDPFGKGGRTVIRPRPGGAAPAGSGSSNPNATVFSNQPFGGDMFTGGRDPALAGKAGQNDWISQQTPIPEATSNRKPPARKIPLSVALNAHTGANVKATNPISQAAVPLLVLLGRLRQMVVEMDAVPLMQHVSRSITEFERTLLGQGIDKDQVQISKYTLCATADDIVQNLPGTEKHVWLQYSMLAQFFGARTSGTVLFDKIRELLTNPIAYYDSLELIHACLSLGFEGQYRTAAGGDVELQRVRRDVFHALRTVRPRGTDEISPRWRGVNTKLGRLGDGVPLWAAAAAAAALLAGLYVLLRFLITAEGDAAAGTLVQMHPKTPVEIGRSDFKPLEGAVYEADTTQVERIRAVLAPEVSKGLINVQPKGEKIVVEVSNVLLFASGSAELRAEFEPLAKRIAEALDKEPGSIDIIGHTDNVKLKATNRFKSNYDLSVARAEAAAAMIKGMIEKPDRITVSGRGEDDPAAPNNTAEGRTKNRRVDVTIPREETL